MKSYNRLISNLILIVIFLIATAAQIPNSSHKLKVISKSNKAITSADLCSDVTEEETLYPMTDVNFESMDYYCLEGTLADANPDDLGAIGGCDFSQTPTVWFKVVTDFAADQLYTTVITEGSWTPMWSVFKEDDCDYLELAVSGSEPPCSLNDLTPDLQQTFLEDFSNTFHIAVSADPNGNPIDDPDFEICAASILTVLICLGDFDDNCDPDPSTSIKIVHREFDYLELGVDPDNGYVGPFCPGEEVQVNISFFYDATQTGADWFHGIVPDFGVGWDTDLFDFEANLPLANGRMATWHAEGSDCAPYIQEIVGNLCTYRDEYGTLRLCNALCESCIQCEHIGLEEDDALASGYFWLSNGSNSGCVSGSCKPGEQWGIGSTTSSINWDFNLRVREFENEEERMKLNNLQLSFQSFSDGGAGCWEDPLGECVIDKKQMGPLWKVAGLDYCDIKSSNDSCGMATLFSIVDTLLIDNSMSTPDYYIEDCDSLLQEHSVWYKFWIPNDALQSSYDINILSEEALFNMTLFSEACDTFPIASVCQDTSLRVNCLSPGQIYYLQVSSMEEWQGIPLVFEEELNECCYVNFEMPEQTILCSWSDLNLPVTCDEFAFIKWEVEENPLVGGYSDGILYDTSIVIIQNLFVLDGITEAQEIVYNVSTYLYEDSLCLVEPKQHRVILLPQISFTTDTLPDLCYPFVGTIDIEDLIISDEPDLDITWSALDDISGHEGMGTLIDIDNSYPPGNYNFLIRILDSKGCLTIGYLGMEIIGLPEAAFFYLSDSLTVEFINDTNGADYYQWYFGDGTHSEEKDPVHTYASEGTYEVSLYALNECGVDSFIREILIDLTATQDVLESEKILLYPNPNSGDFYIDFNELGYLPEQILIYNIKGEVLETFNDLEGHRVNIKQNGLNVGVYMLQMIFDDKIIHKKLLIVK